MAEREVQVARTEALFRDVISTRSWFEPFAASIHEPTWADSSHQRDEAGVIELRVDLPNEFRRRG
jgi:hypothetical protein